MNIFIANTVNYCEHLFLERALADSKLWLNWFIIDKVRDTSKMLLGIRDILPAVFCKNKNDVL